MENKIATVVWNEFIAQTANNGINFSFTDLERRVKETIDEALRQAHVSGQLLCYLCRKNEVDTEDDICEDCRKD